MLQGMLAQALALDPDYEEAWHNLGQYLLTDYPVDSEQSFRRALQLDPQRSGSYWRAGTCVPSTGKIS